MKDIRAFYDKTAQEWADDFYANEDSRPCMEAFIRRLPEGARVLDLCCGAGYDTARLAQYGIQAVGMDFSTESLRIAREKNPGIPFYEGDMLEDYTSLGRFDGIWCCAGIVHVPEEKLRQAFEHMAHVLKAGGLLMAIVRDGTGKREQQSRFVIDGEEYDRAFYAHTREEMERCAQGLLAFKEEILPDEGDIWKRYLFERKV